MSVFLNPNNSVAVISAYDEDKNIRKVDKNKIQDLLNKAPMVQSLRRGVNPANNIIPQNSKIKPSSNLHRILI